MNLDTLLVALRESWGPDTAYPGSWDDSNPAKGQCAVSSLVIQRLIGGDIWRGRTNTGISHYWNVIEDAKLDATWSQFRDGEWLTWEKPVESNIERGHTKERLDILWNRVLEWYDTNFR